MFLKDRSVKKKDTSSLLRKTPSTTIPKAVRSDATQTIKIIEPVSQQGIADVFNTKIREAIKGETFQRNGTTYLKAAISMLFPIHLVHDCIMTLVIHEDRVEDLAKTLFNLKIETQKHGRYFRYSEGCYLAPSPEFVVKGIPNDVILAVFGPQIYAAVQASIIRKKKLEAGLHVSQSISMVIPVNPADPAVINLTLDTICACRIRTKIFQ